MKESMHVVCAECRAINRVPALRLAAAKCGRCHRPLFQAKPFALDDSNFDRHLERDELPLLVDFWATWCAPCRMMAPVIEQAARRFEPRLRIAKVDTDAAPGLAQRFAIRSIPTLAMFRGGVEAARTAGAMDASTLDRWIQALLTS